MSVTEVTHESWFGRIGNAFKGMLLGLIFVVGSIALLFWNEGRAVHRYKALNEGAKNVVSIQADKVDSANEGKLVCLSGQATTDTLLKDDVFKISVKALKLRRTVEMYQWVQQEERKTKRNTGGSTETTVTYNYAKQWSQTLIPSEQFKDRKGHDNPTAMPWE
ncbi:MAG: TMEM43 family protein, partial [Planctomycetia bacterium]|nr:TMEM43 family protein [Planctomycetia bacterium]